MPLVLNLRDVSTHDPLPPSLPPLAPPPSLGYNGPVDRTSYSPPPEDPDEPPAPLTAPLHSSPSAAEAQLTLLTTPVGLTAADGHPLVRPLRAASFCGYSPGPEATPPCMPGSTSAVAVAARWQSVAGSGDVVTDLATNDEADGECEGGGTEGGREGGYGPPL